MQEAKNIFLETPKGLQRPMYTVVAEGEEGYEIRAYEQGYTVASTTMGKIGEPYSNGQCRKQRCCI